jgi:hypothetical protein
MPSVRQARPEQFHAALGGNPACNSVQAEHRRVCTRAGRFGHVIIHVTAAVFGWQ